MLNNKSMNVQLQKNKNVHIISKFLKNVDVIYLVLFFILP